MIKPYDLGEFNLRENTQSIRIDELVRRVNHQLKEQLLKSEIYTLGIHISVITSKTRFGGKRYWFLCPCCNKRKGVLYSNKSGLACGECLNLIYRKQKFKGMTDLDI